MGRRGIVLLVGTLCAVASTSPGAASARTPACDRHAAPDGSDANTGTAEQPFATAQRLADALASGQVGCLRRGTYTAALAITTAGIRLTSEEPAAPARIQAPSLRIDAAGVVIEGLDIVTASAPLQISGDRAAIRGNTFSGGTVCVRAGETSADPDDDVAIVGNDFTGCGGGAPANAAVTLAHARGARVTHNVFHGITDGTGVAAAPDADRVAISHNTFAGLTSAVRIGSRDGARTSGARISDNVFAGNGTNPDVSTDWQDGIGQDNLVAGNCVDAGADANSGTGITNGGNRVIAGTVEFLDGFTLPPQSPCIGLGVQPGGSTDGTGTITQESVEVLGTIEPHGQPMRWYVELGQTGSVSRRTAIFDAPPVRTPIAVRAVVAGLHPGIAWDYRIVAETIAGNRLEGETRQTETVFGTDTDGDGVPDFQDNCRTEPGGAPNGGCPIGAGPGPTGRMALLRVSDMVRAVRCSPGPTLRLRISAPLGDTIRYVRFVYAGRSLVVRGERLRRTVVLRRLPRSFLLKTSVRMDSGRFLRARQRYRRCR